MPKREKYGAQPPLELLRMSMDIGGWYDRKTLDYKKIIDIQFVSSMGTGRQPLPNRLKRHYNILYSFEYDDETIRSVFTEILNYCLKEYPTPMKALTPNIVSACTELYKCVQKEFPPLPKKPHYQFNLRDLSKTLQGMVSVPRTQYEETETLKDDLLKLWVYESTASFSDRFIDNYDKNKLRDIQKKIGFQDFKIKMSEVHFAANFGNFLVPGTEIKEYVKIDDLASIKPCIEGYITEYNETYKNKINILLFDEAVENLTKINRILARPYGHGLLIGLGGDGRKTLSRLASFMQDFKNIEELPGEREVINADWLDFLQGVLKNAGVEENP